jgi:hypothetical protein
MGVFFCLDVLKLHVLTLPMLPNFKKIVAIDFLGQINIHNEFWR